MQLFPLPGTPSSLFLLLSETVIRANKISSAFATDLHHNLVLTLKGVGTQFIFKKKYKKTHLCIALASLCISLGIF